MRATPSIDIGIGIAAAIWLLAAVGHVSAAAPDMVYFWGAANLLKSEANPYDMKLIQELATANIPEIGRLTGGFFNPPHTLLYIRWLAEFDLKSAILLWKIFSILLILIPLRIFCRRNLSESESPRVFKEGLWIGVYLASFAPVLFLVNIGQISALSVAGVCLCMAWRNGSFLERIGSGLALSLATIKPHIVLLPLMLIAFDIMRGRLRSLPLISTFFVIVAIIPALCYPASFQQWWGAQNTLPLAWFQPTLSGWLLATLGPDLIIFRVLPILFSAAVVIWLDYGNKATNACSRTLTPFLVALPLGLFTAPYAWVYDFVVILPSGMALLYISMAYTAPTYSLLRLNMILLFGANLLMMYGPAEMQYYV
jgi:hypothetical protein